MDDDWSTDSSHTTDDWVSDGTHTEHIVSDSLCSSFWLWIPGEEVVLPDGFHCCLLGRIPTRGEVTCTARGADPDSPAGRTTRTMVALWMDVPALARRVDRRSTSCTRKSYEDVRRTHFFVLCG